MGHAQGSLAKLAVGAIGIVFGDIGTSPIYAFRETFAGHHTLIPDQLHIYGVLSLIFWSMMIIVTLKYVTIIMRADNKGEGGSLALLALINRTRPTRNGRRDRHARRVRHRAVLRRQHDHAGDLGAVGGRGPDHRQGGFEPFVIPIAIGSWSACSRSSRAARPRSA
jgi:KUP system potassium uptake protein